MQSELKQQQVQQAPPNVQTDRLQQDSAKPYTFTARVNYNTAEEATMVMNALAVDPELRPEAVTREISVDGSTLVLNFAAVDMRTLRAAVGTFCDLLKLATETLEAFGPGAAAEPADDNPAAEAADDLAAAAAPAAQLATAGDVR